MPVPLYLQRPSLQRQGFFDASGNPTGGLTLDDLYQGGGDVPDVPQLPTHIDSMSGLSEEDRKRIRNRAILQAALAFAAPGGRVGEALAAAAAGGQDAQQAAIDSQNKEMDQHFQLQREQYTFTRQHAQDEAAQEAEKLAAQNRLAKYQQIRQQDPALAQEAEGAARSADDKRLQALLESIPGRQAEQNMGYDPSDPFVQERVKAQLQAEADAKKRKAVLEDLPTELKVRSDAELATLPQKLALETDAEVAKRKQLAAQGLLFAKTDHPEERWKPEMRVQNGHLVMFDFNKIDKATGKPSQVDLGVVKNGGRPIVRQFENSMGHKETWVSEMDPETGQYGPFQPAKMNDTRPNGGTPAPTPPGPLHQVWDSGVDAVGGELSRAAAGVRSWLGSFTGTDKTSHPAAPAPKAVGAPSSPANPSPMLDQPAGAPVAGRGQGPATGRSPLRGNAAQGTLSGSNDPTESAAQSIEKQTGALPSKIRTQLKQRLAAGADPQQELQHLLASKPGTKGGSQ